jgi:hypothetical protein
VERGRDTEEREVKKQEACQGGRENEAIIRNEQITAWIGKGRNTRHSITTKT